MGPGSLEPSGLGCWALLCLLEDSLFVCPFGFRAGHQGQESWRNLPLVWPYFSLTTRVGGWSRGPAGAPAPSALPPMASCPVWESCVGASFSLAPFSPLSDFTETHHVLPLSTLHGSQGHCGFLQVCVSLVLKPTFKRGQQISSHWFAGKSPSPLQSCSHTNTLTLYIYIQTSLAQVWNSGK